MNSKKACKQCKTFWPVDKLIRHPVGTFCDNNKCVMLFISKNRERKILKKAKDFKKKTRKAVRDLDRKSVRWQHSLTQVAFNRMRVLQELAWFYARGLRATCISCGNQLGGDQWCCGHLKTVGAQGVLRYDPKNAYLQHNRNCNQGLSADLNGTKTTHGYIQGLKNRFGDAEGQKIIDYCETHAKIRRWDWQELEGMRQGFNVEIRRIKAYLL